MLFQTIHFIKRSSLFSIKPMTTNSNFMPAQHQRYKRNGRKLFEMQGESIN